MSILPLMTFHTESVGTAKLTCQIRMEKSVLIQINKIPVLIIILKLVDTSTTSSAMRNSVCAFCKA